MKTVVLRAPFGRVAFGALALLAVFCLLAEILARRPAVEAVLPDESYGSAHAHFNTQVTRILRRVKEDGPLDCIFLGDSQVLHDIDPAIVEERLAEAMGRPVRCQNFGLGGMSILYEDQLARVLMARFEPAVMVIGVSELSFVPSGMDTSARTVTVSPWVQQQSGRPSVDGWLLEHSSAYRHYVGATAWLFDKFPQNPEIQANGYSIKFADKSTMSVEDQLVYFQQYYERVSISQLHQDGLARLMAMNSVATRILVVEMPVDPQYFGLHSGLQSHFDEYRRGLAETAQSAGGDVWLTQDALALPEDAWHDLIHLGRPGTIVFSRWIADQMAPAMPDALGAAQ